MSRPTRTLLYIDDDPATRFLLQRLFEERETTGGEPEIEWLEASSVEEAVFRYGTEQPDTILLDNRLGADDGVDLLPQVHKTWRCPVWILTGACGPELMERAVRAGAAGIIEKGEVTENPGRLCALLTERP